MDNDSAIDTYSDSDDEYGLTDNDIAALIATSRQRIEDEQRFLVERHAQKEKEFEEQQQLKKNLKKTQK